MSGEAPAPASGGGESSTGSATSATPATPADSGAPRTTSDIASAIVERNDQGGDEPEESARAQTDLTAAERFSDEEKLLRDSGFKRALKADGTEHFIPRSKVLAIIANARKQSREQWTAEKTAIEQETQALREFRDGFANSLRGDSDQFLAYISQHDPRYRRYLERQAEPPATNGQRPPADGEEPQPDLEFANGAKSYSREQLQKWMDWHMDQRLAPFQQEREEARRQADARARDEQLRETVRGQLDTAKTWPHWNDYEQDILKKLQADTAQAKARGQRPQMSLREAFLEVRAERLEAAGDPARVREQVIADINAAPRSTGLRTSAEVPRTAGIRSTADIARSIIEKGDRAR